MTAYKTIICLANSRKEGGCCVAGKEIVNEQITSNWIRPVSHSPLGELSRKTIILYSNRFPKWLFSFLLWFKKSKPQPQLLDIIRIPLLQHQSHRYQSENFLIDHRAPWIKQGTISTTQLSQLVDTVPMLWINGYHSWNGLNDRIPIAFVESRINTSLLLIKAENLVILVDQELRKIKIRAEFYFNEQQYRLAVTEPKIESLYRFKAAGKYPITEDHYLCISLGEPFEGYCYKLIAAIL
jgi:hypothetical protein